MTGGALEVGEDRAVLLAEDPRLPVRAARERADEHGAQGEDREGGSGVARREPDEHGGDRDRLETVGNESDAVLPKARTAGEHVGQMGGHVGGGREGGERFVEDAIGRRVPQAGFDGRAGDDRGLGRAELGDRARDGDGGEEQRRGVVDRAMSRSIAGTRAPLVSPARRRATCRSTPSAGSTTDWTRPHAAPPPRGEGWSLSR